MRPRLRDLRLLPALHRLLRAGTQRAEHGAENQLCPTAAIKRTYVEDPYYQYTIDEQLCIGCAKCVEGCNRFGNGSLFLQIRHDRCLNCNECAICPHLPRRRLPPRAGGSSVSAENHQPLKLCCAALKFIGRCWG